MAFTDIDTIRTFLQEVETPDPTVQDDLAILDGYDPAYLTFRDIDEDSEVVKITRQYAPSADTGNPLTLNAGVPVSFSSQYVKRGSVVVANSLSLSVIYTENDDFIIDYTNGTIERSSVGSAIADGGTVYVWYLPFVVLTKGNDYNINYAEGSLNRRAGTTVPDGATVYVDFSHGQASITNSLIIECIDQTDAFLKQRLLGSYTAFTSDETLIAASTQYCLHLLSLSQAVRELRVNTRENADDIAETWFKLAQQYLGVALTTFSKYFSVTDFYSGGILENRFSSQRSRSIASPSISRSQRNR
jgi:hypothetical protein